MSAERIYLDHHAATPLVAAARDAMIEAGQAGWANPASAHGAGRASRAILERARARVAASIGASAADVTFTSGGTEACNLAVLGLAASRARPGEIVTTAIEHPAIASAVARLEGDGWRIVRLPVPEGAPPSADDVASAITPETALIVAQMINHETGTILPVASYGAIARARSIPLAIDATQALGKVAVDVGALGASAVAIASHKIGGPSGAGALWIARDAELEPQLVGGAQEHGRRAGSADVVAMAGFGAACSEVEARLLAMPAVAARRDRVLRALLGLDMHENATRGPRVATVAHASSPRWTGTALVAALDLEGLCVASGAACSSGVDRPSPVVAAMHSSEPWRATGALRVSLGPETTDDEIDRAVAIFSRVLARRGA